MQILVQKYGGTSVATADARLSALHHIEMAAAQGYRVVVVVSAMGRKGDPFATDTLLSTVDNVDTVNKRDLDILLSCGENISAVVFSSLLKSHGHEVTVMTGQQAGIITDNQFGEARIVDVRPDRILQHLESGEIVIVAGFQGATEEGDITTLGRGGSDTSASALGTAIKAERIEVFTDVEGIMTADPRIVPTARPLQHMTYYDVCNLAYQGAKVIHPRAVEIAMQNKIPIRVRSTFSENAGTEITTNVAILECSVITQRMITGITQKSNVVQIQVTGDIDPSLIFSEMGKNEIGVDLISILPTHVTFIVDNTKAQLAVRVLDEMGYLPKVIEDCAKISVIGTENISSIYGIMAQAISALAKKNIEILQSSDSQSTMWFLVRQEQMRDAVQAIHDAFGMDKCS
ncbi:aspartate kinase [Alicyclobacillus sp. SO9]|uniref:aspartate kinase n=1 Tax=Alicyclobacillus sp. SO9 TaxID=2665646 RepID=UPI0018E86773|nr:aspartate kinase [Alicyclobacillus sp. SO9]QQE81072.1 aspartate kinase [Alicyclobacillus sp. SO9]